MSLEPALSSHFFTLWPLLAAWLITACAAAPQPEVTLYPQKGTAVRVSVEIADTNEKRSFGLMYRRELLESHGMLFLFPRQGPQSFWMKNTPLPLDILFIDTSLTIVSIARNTTPYSEKPLPSDKPARFVLEVNGGFCQRHGIAVGDRVELPSR
ncbi:MAG: DUF192 domain-containing protein [Deltaproteobacteria bacterium]|nr:DUF192 domain-containing protein [Deltaproteobacteria bacterium]